VRKGQRMEGSAHQGWAWWRACGSPVVSRGAWQNVQRPRLFWVSWSWGGRAATSAGIHFPGEAKPTQAESGGALRREEGATQRESQEALLTKGRRFSKRHISNRRQRKKPRESRTSPDCQGGWEKKIAAIGTPIISSWVWQIYAIWHSRGPQTREGILPEQWSIVRSGLPVGLPPARRMSEDQEHD